MTRRGIHDFTMTLKYDDGRVWSDDFSIYGDDPKDLTRLTLKTGLLHREQRPPAYSRP